MGSAFTQVLANIYMYQWEKEFIEHQTMRNEIYGRLSDTMNRDKYLNLILILFFSSSE